MISEQFTELDKTLQSLNGLHDDSSSSIREVICNYVRENGMIAIFAYASLLWNPIEHVAETIYNCILNGYAKRFICEDFVYRGTTECTGLTMGLQEDPDSYVNGALLISKADKIIEFLRAFVERETPTSINGIKMDIYRYDFVPIVKPDGSIQYALTCMANKKSSFCLKQQLTLDQQARKMAIAYGNNGTNLQYLQRALDSYSEHGLKDSCTDKFKDLHNKINSCREKFQDDVKNWLKEYDELKTPEERQSVLPPPQDLLNRQANNASDLPRTPG
jgi:cation transport regulator ChaC